MHTGKPSKGKRICCLAVSLIALWLGGLGCGLCCASDVVAAYYEEPATSCHATAHAEHFQNQSVNSTDSISSQADLKDCSLLPNRATSLAVTPRVDDAPALPEEQLVLTEGIISHKEVFIPGHLPLNRGQVYLRICALLI